MTYQAGFGAARMWRQAGEDVGPGIDVEHGG